MPEQKASECYMVCVYGILCDPPRFDQMKELAHSQGGFSLVHKTGRVMFLSSSGLEVLGFYGNCFAVCILANKYWHMPRVIVYMGYLLYIVKLPNTPGS